MASSTLLETAPADSYEDSVQDERCVIEEMTRLFHLGQAKIRKGVGVAFSAAGSRVEEQFKLIVRALEFGEVHEDELLAYHPDTRQALLRLAGACPHQLVNAMKVEAWTQYDADCKLVRARRRKRKRQARERTLQSLITRNVSPASAREMLKVADVEACLNAASWLNYLKTYKSPESIMSLGPMLEEALGGENPSIDRLRAIYAMFGTLSRRLPSEDCLPAFFSAAHVMVKELQEKRDKRLKQEGDKKMALEQQKRAR